MSVFAFRNDHPLENKKRAHDTARSLSEKHKTTYYVYRNPEATVFEITANERSDQHHAGKYTNGMQITV